jgi:hypothetical protein
MDWSRSTVTSSVRDLASVGEEPLLAHVVVERRHPRFRGIRIRAPSARLGSLAVEGRL